jgi:hypothetical protein
MSPQPEPLTDAMVACLLRAAREYRQRMQGELQRAEERAKHGNVLAQADAATYRLELGCIQKAVLSLWHAHANRTL